MSKQTSSQAVRQPAKHPTKFSKWKRERCEFRFAIERESIGCGSLVTKLNEYTHTLITQQLCTNRYEWIAVVVVFSLFRRCVCVYVRAIHLFLATVKPACIKCTMYVYIYIYTILYAYIYIRSFFFCYAHVLFFIFIFFTQTNDEENLFVLRSTHSLTHTRTQHYFPIQVKF